MFSQNIQKIIFTIAGLCLNDIITLAFRFLFIHAAWKHKQIWLGGKKNESHWMWEGIEPSEVLLADWDAVSPNGVNPNLTYCIVSHDFYRQSKNKNGQMAWKWNDWVCTARKFFACEYIP